MRALPEKIDLSSFLVLINAVIAAGILVLFLFRGTNEFVNAYTVYLSMAFAAQNHFFLTLTRRKPDPLLLLLAMQAVVFYELRVATLLWDPWFTVLARTSCEAGDLSNGLLYVILANFAVFLGLNVSSANKGEAAPLRDAAGVSVRVFLPVLLVILGLSFETGFGWLAGLQGYLGILFNVETILFFSFVLMLLYYEVLSNRQKALIFGTAFAFIAYRTAIGNRSAVMTLCLYLLYAWAAVKGHVVFKRKVYVTVLAIIPLTVALFILATQVRWPNSRKHGVPYQTIFDRIGFLDMSAEIGANSNRYGNVLNFEYYFKSIVDNGLTPGFSIFDAPKAGNALVYTYLEKSGVSLKAVSTVYQSDMLTAYGETYVLFGPLGGLVTMFLAAFLFQWLYRAIRTDDPFRLSLLRAVVLYVFYTYFLCSFGIDWFVVDLVRGVVPFMLLLYLFLRYVRYVPGRSSGELP